MAEIRRKITSFKANVVEPVGYVVLMFDGELWQTGTPRRPRLYKNGGTATAALKIVFGRVPAGYRIVPVGPVGTDFPIER